MVNLVVANPNHVIEALKLNELDCPRDQNSMDALIAFYANLGGKDPANLTRQNVVDWVAAPLANRLAIAQGIIAVWLN